MKLYDLSKVAMSAGAPYLKRSEQMRCTKDHWDAIALAVAKAVVEECVRRSTDAACAKLSKDKLEWVDVTGDEHANAVEKSLLGADRGPGGEMTGMTITADDLDDLRHMLGANPETPRKMWGYRNRYVGHTPSMDRLVAAGFARISHPGNELSGGDPIYCATREGCRAAGMTAKEIARMERGSY